MADTCAATVPSSHGDPAGIPALPPARAATRQMVVAGSSPTVLVKPRRRTRPLKDSKVYKVALAAVAMRAAQGSTYKEIGEALGYTGDTVKAYLQYAVKRGWLNLQSFTDPDDQLEYVLKTKVVRNLSAVLDETKASSEQDNAPSFRAGDAAIEAAKGLGLFKQHQVVKGEQQTTVGVALRVDVHMPPENGPVITVRPGTVGGSPGLEIPADAIDAVE